MVWKIKMEQCLYCWTGDNFLKKPSKQTRQKSLYCTQSKVQGDLHQKNSHNLPPKNLSQCSLFTDYILNYNRCISDNQILH